MGLRVLIASVMAVLAVTPNANAADEYRPGAKKRVYSSHRTYRYYESRGLGGQLFGDQHTPYVRAYGGNTNAPYTSQTFWERVETQPDYPVR